MTKNNLFREVATKSIFSDMQKVLNTTNDFEQGDLLIFDDTANTVEKPVAEADGATFLGTSKVTIVDGHVKDVYTTDVDASVAITSVPGPIYGSEFRVFLKVGDTLAPGDFVYLDPVSGPKFVQAAGTKAVGIYQGGAVTAVAGTEIIVLLGARHPGDTLRF